MSCILISDPPFYEAALDKITTFSVRVFTPYTALIMSLAVLDCKIFYGFNVLVGDPILAKRELLLTASA